MKPPFSYVPLLPVLISLAAGVLLYTFSNSIAVPLSALALATPFFFTKRSYIGSLLCAVSLGWCASAVSDSGSIPESYLITDRTYQCVADEGFDTDNGYKIKGEITGYISSEDSMVHTVNPQKISITVPAANLTVFPRDTIYFRGEVYRYKNNPDIPDEFNPGMFEKGETKFRVKQAELKIAGNAGGIRYRLAKFRNYLGVQIVTSGVSQECANFLLAALLGDTGRLTEEERSRFTNTGMSHILALSGAHVAIIMTMLLIALLPLSVAKMHTSKNVIIIIILWGYVVMTGCSPSVTRAVIMVTLLLIGRISGRPYGAMNSLCMAAILILLFSPDSLFLPGFQLSFMAVASISLLSEPLNPFRKTWMYRPWGWVATTVAATLGTLGLVLYHFHFFPLYLILIAPLATFLLTMVIFGGIALIICGITGLPTSLPALFTDKIFSFTYRYLGIAESLPDSSVSNVYISLFTALILTLIPFAIAGYITYKKKWILVTSATAICVTLLFEIALKPSYPETEMFITDNPYNLEIVVKSGKTIYLITDADLVQSPLQMHQFVTSHKNYIGKRGISDFQIVIDSVATPVITKDHRLLKYQDKMFLILNNDRYAYSSPYPIDYLIVSNGFRGSLKNAVDSIKPQQVILARNLNTRLRKRYTDELQGKVTDMKETGTIKIP